MVLTFLIAINLLACQQMR